MRDSLRSSTRSALTLGAFAATALVWSGCEAKKQTEYVAGVSTQVQVPRDLKAIRVDVSVGGVVQFCRGYRVYDGKVQLPRSLGEFPSQGKPGPDPITVTVSGFTEELLGDHRQQRVRQLHERRAQGRRQGPGHAHPAT